MSPEFKPRQYGCVSKMTEDAVVEILSQVLRDEYEFLPIIHTNLMRAVHRRKNALRKFRLTARGSKFASVLAIDFGSLEIALKELLGGSLPDFLVYRKNDYCGRKIPLNSKYRRDLVRRCFRKAFDEVTKDLVFNSANSPSTQPSAGERRGRVGVFEFDRDGWYK